MSTGFFWDEKCFWHGGGDFAFTLPLGGLVQPMSTGGLPENPETKRRLKNLMDVTGLLSELDTGSHSEASVEDLLRVHPREFLEKFKTLSDENGGTIGLNIPFSKGGFEIASLSAGLAKGAVFSVLKGINQNSYALSRPPGHHCLRDLPNGFCLLSNISIAVEAALAEKLTERVAIVDWDVHHGNGTEAIFYDRADVLTISVHQDRCYPIDTGAASDIGVDMGEGYNMNIPLPAGGGHALYVEAMERLILPRLREFQPDIIIIACGFDASAIDPLARMLATSETFGQLTKFVMGAANELCSDRLAMVHEGGYSEVYVPFCGHRVIQELSSSSIKADDPYKFLFESRQPNQRVQNFYSELITELEQFFF
jgi:acetoin utilization deacetylase AcuC-like enzyme